MNTATSVSNSPAIAGFVCSVLGVVLFMLVLPPLILGPTGLILGLQGRGRAARGGDHGSLANAAIIIGAIALVLPVAMLLLLAAGLFMEPEVSGTPQTGPIMPE